MTILSRLPTIDYSDNPDSKEYSDKLMKALSGKKYFIRTYGCQLNENDSEKMAGLLDSFGMTEGVDFNDGDVIIFNTCTIRENANDKIFGNLGMVKNIKKHRPETIVVMCGCMMKEPHNQEKVLKKYNFVDIVFGPSDIHRLPELLVQRLEEEHRIYDVGEDDFVSESLPVHHKKKFRALTTIIYGCNNFCTYCIVPYVRGRERSREPELILKELREIGEQGFKEVMLLGQNVNSYGKDLPHVDFADLLQEAGKIKAIERIRFMTSHPKDISRKLIDVMAENDTIMPHLHLPIQSGSDKILKRMNRGYTSGQYKDIVHYAREKIPDITITTDIIVGFPGETEEDFAETLELMAEIRFDNAFTFIYSPRQGTPAADFDLQVDEKVVKERFNRLVTLQNECSYASNASVLNTYQIVLAEGFSENSRNALSGRTPHNRLVNFTFNPALVPAGIRDADDDFEGLTFKVLITSAKTFSLDGEAVEWLS